MKELAQQEREALASQNPTLYRLLVAQDGTPTPAEQWAWSHPPERASLVVLK